MGKIANVHGVFLCARHWGKYFMCITLFDSPSDIGNRYYSSFKDWETEAWRVLFVQYLPDNKEESHDLNPSLILRLALFTKEKATEPVNLVVFIYSRKQPHPLQIFNPKHM